MPHTVRVWDLPTRIFHWTLMACVLGLIVTGQIGGSAMDWHFRLGYTVLALLLFRLLWGFVGGHWSRFVNFLYSPATLLRYLRSRNSPGHEIGHSPLGALSVFALLLMLLLQVGTGLISDDEIATSGPLARLAPGAWVSLATSYHAKLGKLIVIALALLHMAAIAYYRLHHGKNLVRAMLVGDKVLDTPAAIASRDDARSRALAAVLMALCAGLVVALLAWAA